MHINNLYRFNTRHSIMDNKIIWILCHNLEIKLSFHAICEFRFLFSKNFSNDIWIPFVLLSYKRYSIIFSEIQIYDILINKRNINQCKSNINKFYQNYHYYYSYCSYHIMKRRNNVSRQVYIYRNISPQTRCCSVSLYILY